MATLTLHILMEVTTETVTAPERGLTATFVTGNEGQRSVQALSVSLTAIRWTLHVGCISRDFINKTYVV
jgi:hypothetical protein